MTNAAAQIDTVSRTCRTADALVAGINQLVKNNYDSERVVKKFPNGLIRVEVLDKNGSVIGDYTKAA